MSKIDLRGVIVPSEYDQDWLAEYIDKGLFVPESHFRSKLSEASPFEPLTVHVNSPGGSVFAAYEMVNAVLDWKRNTEQEVIVEIGAMAASAASSFAVMCADKIGCYANSKMMFHGATTMTWAGKQAHEDVADILGQINDDVKSILIVNYGMDAGMVDEWFSEGREGWLSAKDLTGAGIVDYQVGEMSSAVEFSAEDIDNVQGRGLQIAAMLELKDETMSVEETVTVDSAITVETITNERGASITNEAVEETLEVEDVGGTDGIETDEGSVEQVSDAPSLEQAERDNQIIESCSIAYDEGFEAGKREGAKDADEQLVSTFEELKSKCESLNKSLEMACTDLEEMTEDRDLLAEKVLRMTAGFLAPEGEVARPQNWTEALAECDGDYALARKKYPSLYNALRQSQKKERNQK